MLARALSVAAERAPAAEAVADGGRCTTSSSPFAAMLRQTTGDVRMMMLHSNVGQSLKSKGILAREIPGMQVVCHRLRDNVKKLFEVRDALNEGAISLVVFQVTDVVAQEGILPPGQTKGVLQLAAAGEP